MPGQAVLETNLQAANALMGRGLLSLLAPDTVGDFGLSYMLSLGMEAC